MCWLLQRPESHLLTAGRRAARMAARAAAKPKMMWEALREAIDEEMEKDPTVLVMGASPCPHVHHACMLIHWACHGCTCMPCCADDHACMPQETSGLPCCGTVVPSRHVLSSPCTFALHHARIAGAAQAEQRLHGLQPPVCAACPRVCLAGVRSWWHFLLCARILPRCLHTLCPTL